MPRIAANLKRLTKNSPLPLGQDKPTLLLSGDQHRIKVKVSAAPAKLEQEAGS